MHVPSREICLILSKSNFLVTNLVFAMTPFLWGDQAVGCPWLRQNAQQKLAEIEVLLRTEN
jgi:hypothetical protein